MSQFTTVNEYGSHPLLMVDVKGCFSQQVWVQPLSQWYMSKSTTVNEYGFTPFANGGCQSLLQSTRMGSHQIDYQV